MQLERIEAMAVYTTVRRKHHFEFQRFEGHAWEHLDGHWAKRDGGAIMYVMEDKCEIHEDGIVTPFEVA